MSTVMSIHAVKVGLSRDCRFCVRPFSSATSCIFNIFPHFNSAVILAESLKFLFAAVLDSTCVQPEPTRTDSRDGGSLITFTYRIVIPFQFPAAYAHLIQVPFPLNSSLSLEFTLIHSHATTRFFHIHCSCFTFSVLFFFPPYSSCTECH